MSNEQYGPLRWLLGTWEGSEGVNVSYDYAEKKIIETPYSETATFSILGDVHNGEQTLWVLDYGMAAKRLDSGEVFHTEHGYWLWDPARQEVMRCFIIPRGSAILAGGQSTADATKLSLQAKIDDHAYGVLSNPYLIERAKCIKYTFDGVIDGDTWQYEENTIMEMTATGGVMDHTDKNTLRKVSE